MTDEVMDEFERLLPLLAGAGYADVDEHTWHFTLRGVARAEMIAPDR
jgi:hypothetical protein